MQRPIIRTFCLMLSVLLGLSLLAGCTPKTQPDTPPTTTAGQAETTGQTEQTQPTESVPAETTAPTPTESSVPTEGKETGTQTPAPVQPQPTQPKPTEPKPTEPKPTEPAPIAPTSGQEGIELPDMPLG